MNNTNSNNTRRPLGKLSSLSTNLLHMRNPWVTLWWSATFPVFGHIALGKHITGFLLVSWEVFINIKSHLNLAIIYSFTGKFEMTKEVVDIRWLILYVAVFVYAM